MKFIWLGCLIGMGLILSPIILYILFCVFGCLLLIVGATVISINDFIKQIVKKVRGQE